MRKPYSRQPLPEKTKGCKFVPAALFERVKRNDKSNKRNERLAHPSWEV